MINIQLEMAERCMELLMLPEDQTCLLLDLGCGSGLSGSIAEESGHIWLGMDISESMLSMTFILVICYTPFRISLPSRPAKISHICV